MLLEVFCRLGPLPSKSAEFFQKAEHVVLRVQGAERLPCFKLEKSLNLPKGKIGPTYDGQELDSFMQRIKFRRLSDV